MDTESTPNTAARASRAENLLTIGCRRRNASQKSEKKNESAWSRPNLMKLRGYEFEEIVPWDQIIKGMQDG